MKINSKLLYDIIHDPDNASHGNPSAKEDLFLNDELSQYNFNLYSSLRRNSSDGELDIEVPAIGSGSGGSTVKSSGSSGSKGDPETVIKNKKKKTLFEDLHTEKGRTNSRKWFDREILESPTLSTISAPLSPGLTRHSHRVMNQQTFCHFMRRLVGIPDWKILDIFDLFDKEDIGAIKFPEFFMILALYAAREGKRTRKFLFHHSKALFTLLSHNLTAFTDNNPGYRRLGADNFTKLGEMFGFTRRTLRKYLYHKFHFDLSSDFISWSDFVDLYFAIFMEWDETGPDFIETINQITVEEDKPLAPLPSARPTSKGNAPSKSGIKFFRRNKQ